MNELSIIVPIYNSEKYLRRCLESIAKIDFPINVILIDDGSTDSSSDICDEYVKTDQRFRVIHQKNRGLVEARRIGMEEVTSDYLTFVDSDDYVDSTYYSRILRNNNSLFMNSDIVCLGMIEEYQGNVIRRNNMFSDGKYSEEKLETIYRQMLSYGDFFNFGILPNAVCKLYRTDFIKNNTYRVSSNISIGEDADMTFQLMIRAKSVYILNEAPYHYIRREDSMMWKKIESEDILDLESDLRTAFDGCDEEYELQFQLSKYICFIKLLCAPEMILNDMHCFKSKTDRIALYGAGGVGRAIKNSLCNNFSLWVDKNYSYFQSLEVSPIHKLVDEEDKYDKIFIAISNIRTCKNIKQELINMGVCKPIFYFDIQEEES